MTGFVAMAALMKPDYAERARDWRVGAVVYQVFVDRFAPSQSLAGKEAAYAAPKRLRAWGELPSPGRPPGAAGVWSHELDFWGGDLRSVGGKLEYVRGLGADVLYLTPIFASLTNHKYDAQDYRQIAPEFGTVQDLKDLASGLHRRGMKLILDGVFNHMGRTSPMFERARRDPASREWDWFFFG